MASFADEMANDDEIDREILRYDGRSVNRNVFLTSRFVDPDHLSSYILAGIVNTLNCAALPRLSALVCSTESHAIQAMSSEHQGVDGLDRDPK